jgi:hypothetical protein
LRLSTKSFSFFSFECSNLVFKDNPIAKKKKTLSHSNLFLKNDPFPKKKNGLKISINYLLPKETISKGRKQTSLD